MAGVQGTGTGSGAGIDLSGQSGGSSSARKQQAVQQPASTDALIAKIRGFVDEGEGSLTAEETSGFQFKFTQNDGTEATPSTLAEINAYIGSKVDEATQIEITPVMQEQPQPTGGRLAASVGERDEQMETGDAA